MNLRLKRTPGIYLVGFMGSGKSTVGELLARKMGWSFLDLDTEIETSEGVSIPALFERFGEEGFRQIEARLLERHVRTVACGRPCVVALGGGAFLAPASRELLAAHGVTIWLDCPLAVLQARVAGAENRPLARDPVRFAELYAERLPVYRLADVRIEADDESPESIVSLIVNHPEFQ